MIKVKWLNIKFGKEEVDSIQRALNYGDISGFSPIVEEFENKCRDYVGAKYAVACSNGTVALITAFIAMKRYLGKDIKIAVPTWTYIAPVNAASLVGKEVLVDSDLKSHNLSNNLPKNIDVLCPVDMAGVPADYDSFNKTGLPIIADAAESLGALYNNKKVGTLADITTTSFQSAKIIVTGEGGMIFSDNPKLVKHCKDIINQGYGPKGYAEHSHVAKGYNFRMSALNAAVGLVQIDKIDKNLSKRKKTAEIYDMIENDFVQMHQIPLNVNPNYYSYLIMLKSKEVRDDLKKYLASKNIETKLWSPVHFHEPYQNFSNSFPNADYIFDHHLRLPIHNEITEEEASYVLKVINNYYPKERKMINESN